MSRTNQPERLDYQKASELIGCVFIVPNVSEPYHYWRGPLLIKDFNGRHSKILNLRDLTDWWGPNRDILVQVLGTLEGWSSFWKKQKARPRLLRCKWVGAGARHTPEELGII